MTQVGVAGRTTWTTPEDRLDYIQRIAEESEVAVGSVNGTIINARAGYNLKAGTGIGLAGVDNPTANSVDITISNTASTISIPVTVPNGGTGRTALTANSVLVGNGTSAVTQLAAGTNGQVLTMVAGAPAWGDIDCGGA